ncbi:MAG: SpoIID/LytB domain-containing protein [Candidatus Omnitrophica bacterium]|nr:SpoIID/LytB domain-containing protein [Candidatus Omnitrophota bacterium]
MSRRAVGVLLLGLLALAPSAATQPNLEFIRVAVVQNDPEVDLRIQGRFTLRAMHTGDPIWEQRRWGQWAVRAVPEGLAVGEEILPYFGVRIEPQREAAISLNGTRLRGTLEIVRQKDLTLLVINHVALEEYLRGVLSKEAPDYWPPEALKAIAIAARSYAVYRRATKAQGEFDVSGTVLSQDYGGKTAEKAATTKAVRETAGLVVTYQGWLFPTFYHSTCGGMTEHARVMGSFDLPPLAGGVRCRWCTASPFYSWRRRLTREDIAWTLHRGGRGSVGVVRDLRIIKQTPSGRVERIGVVGTQRTLTFSGSEFRALLGFERLRSVFFSLIPVADGFVVDGRGWGHGVGMCQWGAAELARRGMRAEEILSYYYPGAGLASLNELAAQPLRAVGGSS